MITFGLRFDHRLWPGESREAATAIGNALNRPAFSALRRVAYSRRNRASKHQPKTAAAVAEILLSPECDAAELDNGRTGELIASLRVFTGRHTGNWPVENRLITSYGSVPYDPAHPLEIVESFAALAVALDAFSGYILVETGFSAAQAGAVGQAPQPRPPDYPRRARERKAHARYFERLETQIAGPEWGLFLGPGHLSQITPDPAVFPIIRDVGRGKLCLLSDNPEDALTEAFDARLEDARRALAPILMDVSEVPVDLS